MNKMKATFLSLTKFEIGLWIFSLVIVSGSFLIFHSKDILTLIASLIGVTALIFVAKGNALGQILTIVFAVFYGIISFGCRYYGEMITYLGMTAPMALVALINWLRHPYKDSAEVEVSSISKKQLLFMILSSIGVTALFYFILRELGNASLVISTVSITTSYLASYLTAIRSPYYALAYAANDVILIILWIIASVQNINNTPMIACFVMFFANDMYGFFNWRRMKKHQNRERKSAE